MTRPTIDGRISLGNVLTLVAMIGAGALLWGQTQSDVKAIRDDVKRIEADQISQRERLRAVENMVAGQNATLDLILQTLTKIEARLGSIER